MSLILQPQSSFPIVRQIANHLDTDILYVRAVVRNADGDTIATIDLEDKGGQRFQRRYRVPIDSSGQGAYISIITSVYTDSGYTTKSPNYGDEENTYLVFDRVMPAMRGGNGGGTVVDLKAIRKIIAEELDKVKPEPVEVEEPKEVEPMRWDDVLTAIVSVGNELGNSIAKIPTEKVTFNSVISGLNEVKQMIVDKEVTPQTDLTLVIDAVQSLTESVSEELTGYKTNLEETANKLVEDIKTTVKEAVDDAEFVTDVQVKPKKKHPAEKKEPVEPEVPPIDLRKLV